MDCFASKNEIISLRMYSVDLASWKGHVCVFVTVWFVVQTGILLLISIPLYFTYVAYVSFIVYIVFICRESVVQDRSRS